MEFGKKPKNIACKENGISLESLLVGSTGSVVLLFPESSR